MTATIPNELSVTVLDSVGNELGTVGITPGDAFMEKRLWDMVSVIEELEEKTFREYRAIELLDARVTRMTKHDETCMSALRRVFPQTNIDGLFAEHMPTDAINGRAYFLRLLDAILKGLLMLIDNGLSHTWTQVEM